MLEVGLRRINAVAVLDLSGEVNIDSSVFIEKVASCLESGCRDLLANFENVTTIDYAGLSAIAIAYKNTVNHKARMKFINVAVHIRKLFNLVCLDRVFEIYTDEQSALQSFEEERNIVAIQKKQLRRRFKRLPLDIGVGFKTKSEDKFRQGKVLNLSGVGMLVFVDKVYPLGEMLEIRLSLAPSPGPLEINARVSWLVDKKIQPQIYPGMGLEFYHLDQEVQEKIVEFVERNLAMEGEV
jgi:anti-sigma B factor antagonist